MLRIHFSRDDLARVRLAPGPHVMWETVLSCHRLRDRRGPLAFCGWRDGVGPRIARERAALRELAPLVPVRGRFPDFLTPPDAGGHLEAGIDAVRSTPVDLLRADLAALATDSGRASRLRALGDGDRAQSCTATTNDKGTARCSVESVDQPLTEDGTLPVTAEFAGDDAYEPSKDEATVRLQYVSGRAYGLSAEVPLPVLPLSIEPTPDTGAVRTAGAVTRTPPCTQEVEALVLSAGVLCADVETSTGPSSSRASARVSEARLGLPGLPVIEASGVEATSSSTCTAADGGTSLDLRIGGTPVSVPDLPNQGIDLGVGARLVINEQVPADGADPGLTVNAVHLTAPGGIDVVIGSSTTAAHNCPSS